MPRPVPRYCRLHGSARASPSAAQPAQLDFACLTARIPENRFLFLYMALTTQIVRFGIVGLVSNAVLYGLYVLATGAGIQHTIAMTAVFLLGVAQTFVFNKRWSFAYHGSGSRSMLRYLVAYAGAYVINLSAMLLLVDVEGFPHRIVQAVMVVVVAIFLFLVQRLWVFRGSPISVRL